MVGEILLNTVIDYGFFSFWESIIFALFFYYVGKLKKMKWYQIGIMGIGNAIISQICVPLGYQTAILFFMSGIIFEINKMKITKAIKISFLSVFFMLAIEMPYCFLLDLIFKIDFSTANKLLMFFYLIPARIIEIILILKIGGNKMKIWAGAGVTRK